MDEKKLDELLDEMKEGYEHLPDFIDNHTVMVKLDEEKGKKNWKRWMPSIAAIFGLFLFIIMTLTFMDSEGRLANKSESTDEKEGAMEDDQDENNMELENKVKDLEKIKFIDELEAYLEEAKEEFRKNLGIENIDQFHEVQQAQSYISDIRNDNEIMQHYSLDEAKEVIDSIFVTPNMLVEQINNNSGKVEEQLSYYFHLATSFHYSLQNAFSELLIEYRITEENQDELVEFQENLDQYSGPKEMVQFLKAVKKNGYLIEQDKTGKLSVTIDYDHIFNQINSWNVKEGYVRYFKVVSSVETSGGDPFEMEWDQFDTALLELEDIYFTYKDDLDEMIRNEIIHTTGYYLNLYLTQSFGAQIDQPIDAEQEYRSFLENHRDSIYWSLVNQAVKKYEENEWMANIELNDEFHAISRKLRILMNENFANVNIDDIIWINRWPIDAGTNQIYGDYHEEHDAEMLQDLSAFEMTSLFTYAHSKGDLDTYYSLFASDSKWAEMDKESIREELYNRNSFINTAQNSEFVVLEKTDENRVNLFFIQWEEILGSIQMSKVDGVWKVYDLSTD
ncbi:hypothetical protein ACFSTA_15950 [Ornithinibacillus salinisoli]|uniref:DUF4878 domain-containing protein n=1 Tax=Ornithinibacillus salinisoli TaxID=1848459 RepID=A0ABW4W381_9BACI